MKIKFGSNLSVATLRKATALAETIEQKQDELNALLRGERGRKGKVAKCSRQLSPEQRARISEGQRRKWAERKTADVPPAQPTSPG